MVTSGYDVLDILRDGYDLLRRVRTYEPDIIILDYQLLNITGLEVARTLIEDDICPVILLGNESELAFAYDLQTNHNFLCLARPLNRSVIIHSVELIVKNDRKIRSLKKELDDVQKKMELRMKVDQAKRIIMKEFKMTEEEAYRKIQKQSMDKGLPMVEVAKAIIIAYG